MKDPMDPNSEASVTDISSTPVEAKSMDENPKYWRSLEEWGEDPKFKELAEQEFMSSPLKEEDGKDGWARREFLKLMGASLALSTTGCIRRPVEKIVPYATQPEELVVGKPNYYCSSWSDANESFALLVKTVDGRPIKVEGNPAAAGNGKALSARAQAHILSLYDPDRLRGPKRNLLNEKRTNRDTINTDWDYADEKIVAQLKKGGVALLSGYIESPSTRQIIGDFLQAFSGRYAVYEPMNYTDLMRGQELCYGQSVVPRYRFDRAQRIVSIDADFLGTWIAPIAFSRDWKERRSPDPDMGRLISFDSTYSLTASNADIRHRIKPSQQLDVAMALLGALRKGSVYAQDSAISQALQEHGDAAGRLGLTREQLDRMAADLLKHRGKSVVIAGGLPTQTPAALKLQVVVNLLNEILGAEGGIVDGQRPRRRDDKADLDIQGLIAAMMAGEIKTLIIHRSNPAYSLPNVQEFREALVNVEMVVYTGDRIDETGALSHYVLPDDHSMEKWGDVELFDGYVAIQQPTVAPLYTTRAFEFGLLNWAYLAEQGPARLLEPDDWYGYLRNYWRQNLSQGANFEDFWLEVLQKGYTNKGGDIHGAAQARSFRTAALSQLRGKGAPSADGSLELVLYPSIPMLDGSLANIPWLQELPDPISKICWDNFASVSMELARKLSLSEGDVVRLAVGDLRVELPVHIQPGLHDEVVTVAVGYGRTSAGKVGNKVGVNVFPLMQLTESGVVSSGLKVTLEKTSENIALANVQVHHTTVGRPIIGELDLNSYLKKAGSGIHSHKLWTMWPGHEYNGYRWGMTIDLNACTGCSACMIACQAENNVPVVGKKYVLEGREMHWLRVDRYYSGDTAEPEITYQPMLCQHCENAPCETVCPVLATVHSDEGLNEMIYNRCVGTRYCSNNCPYKVRRFNWFNYAKKIAEPANMALNPAVTVRTRGVMEKCTFCVQRIQAAKSEAQLEDRKVRDGEIETACQQTCPTQAIIFGDINDPTTRVSKAFKEEARAYALLEEWHTAPSVRYLSKIRNNDKAIIESHRDEHGGQEKGEH